MNIDICQAREADAEAALAYFTNLLAENLPFIMNSPVPTLEQERAFLKKKDGVRAVLFLALPEG